MRRFFNSLESQKTQREKNRIRNKARAKAKRKQNLKAFEAELIKARLKELEAISTSHALKSVKPEGSDYEF